MREIRGGNLKRRSFIYSLNHQGNKRKEISMMDRRGEKNQPIILSYILKILKRTFYTPFFICPRK